MRHFALPTLAALLLFTACTAEVLSPSEVEPSLRITPVAFQATHGLPVELLHDRDTTTAVAVPQAFELELHFADPVVVTLVKLAGTAVRIEGENVDSVELRDGSAWTTVTVAEPAPRRSIRLTMSPTSPTARLSELEVWAEGLVSAPRDPQRLAVVTSGMERAPWHNLRIVRPNTRALELTPSGLATGSHCARLTFHADGEVRAARRAYLAFAASGLLRASQLVMRANGHTSSGGFWTEAPPDARVLYAELNPVGVSGWLR